MPIQTDLAVNTYFFGADPPAIPFQLTPAADLTAASMAFYIWPLGVALEGQGPLITATTGNGMIVTAGPNTDITSGSFYVQITLVAWAAWWRVPWELPNSGTNLAHRLRQRGASGLRRCAGRVLPGRGYRMSTSIHVALSDLPAWLEAKAAALDSADFTVPLGEMRQIWRGWRRISGQPDADDSPGRR